MEQIHSRIERMKPERDPRTLMQLDAELHEIINRATRNEVLLKMLGILRDQAVRIWTFSHAEHEYWDGLVDEFELLAAALERRDEEESARLLEKHTRRFIEHVRSQFAG